MARYTGPTARLCRREGMHLGIKGTKCDTGKCSSDKRAYPPGEHGQGRIRLSDYGIQLREKQKVKRMYGVLEILERRLDNVVFRMGFATSRREGRQMVGHRAMTVNGRRVTIPSYLVKVGDTIQPAQQRKGQIARIKANLERTKSRPVPGWLQIDMEQLKGTVTRTPERSDLGAAIQEQLIVELYSK